jgi:predicted enzyme related to lactoylglutathione lyase
MRLVMRTFVTGHWPFPRLTMAGGEVEAMRNGQRRVGTVVWLDLSTTDVVRAIHFYEQLFGWHYDEHETEKGTYIVARVPAGAVGGMMFQAPEQVASGVPPCWTVFVGTARLRTTIATARQLGGSVLQSPIALPGGERIAVVADPAGAALGFMESPPSDHGMVWGALGSGSWVECLSRDPASSRRFCEELLGWKGEEGPGGYVVLRLDAEQIGGLMTMPASVPVDAPSHWLVYFAVRDASSTYTRVAELGGAVLGPTQDIDEGRLAICVDPTGAVFGVSEGRRTGP